MFDSFNVNRHTLIENIDVIFNYVNLSDGSSLIEKPLLVEASEYSDNELREWSMIYLGILSVIIHQVSIKMLLS